MDRFHGGLDGFGHLDCGLVRQPTIVIKSGRNCQPTVKQVSISCETEAVFHHQVNFMFTSSGQIGSVDRSGTVSPGAKPGALDCSCEGGLVFQNSKKVNFNLNDVRCIVGVCETEITSLFSVSLKAYIQEHPGILVFFCVVGTKGHAVRPFRSHFRAWVYLREQTESREGGG